MKKLIYLIVLIAILGLIIPGCIPVVPPTGQNESGTLPNKNPSVLNVPTATYPTIQSAIDAAGSGDTVNVAAGEYIEQLLITKSLILLGAGGSTTTIKAPPSGRSTIVESGIAWDYVVAVDGGSSTIDVKIEGFTIDANGQGGSSLQNFAGVFLRNVGDGTNDGLYSCTVYNFSSYGPDWSGTYNTWMGNYGVQVYGTSDLTIHDTDIDNYTVSGISARGVNVDITVTSNDLDGTDSDYAGIYLREATGTISGNNIHDHPKTSIGGIGIYLYDVGSGVMVDDSTSANIFTDNYIGIMLAFSDGVTIDGNTFTNDLHRSIVIYLDSDNNVVKGNTITITDGDALGAIYIGSNSGDNTIGGAFAAEGNIISLPTNGVGYLYAIHLGGVDADAVTIQYNIITGAKRSIQFDGGPGHYGMNTISDNILTGASFGGVISICHGDFAISGNTITDTDRPIEFWQAGMGDISITGNTLSSTAFDGINAVSYSSMVIHCNKFEQLAGGYAVHNRDSSKTIDASHNWWGHATGPYHASTNPLGLGYPVSDYVDYSNWAYIPDFCDCEAKTIGYWKNHPEYVEGILIELDYSIEVGTDKFVGVDVFAEDIFTKPHSKTYSMLAAQLLAAKLNVAQLSQFNPEYDSDCMDDTIDDADDILEIVNYTDHIPKEDKADVNNIKDELDEFNNNINVECPLGDCPCECD